MFDRNPTSAAGQPTTTVHHHIDHPPSRTLHHHSEVARSLRIRALPLHDEVVDFVNECRVVYVAEQNRDGQMADILRLKVPGSAMKIRKILHYNGRPMPARSVEEGVLAGEREPAHA